MMTSGSCGCDIPAVPRNGMAGHYYDPSFRISGAYGYLPNHLSGNIADAGAYPLAYPENHSFVQWVSAVKIRSKPEYKSSLVTGKVKVGTVYTIEAYAREKFAKSEDMKPGDIDRFYFKISDGKEVLGWAIIAEQYRVSVDTLLDMDYGLILSTPDPLSEDLAKAQKAELDSALKAYKKLTSSSGGTTSSGSKIVKPVEEIGQESGIGTGTTVFLGLGAAAVVYYLMTKGKK